MSQPTESVAKFDWHQMFGVVLKDYFSNTPFEVETEFDLSKHKQMLDVVIVRKGKGTLKEPLPDGLAELAPHNLITFKSYHEALDDWALKELTGHYVNYRKQLGQRGEPLLPEGQFRLYAVCCRAPEKLAEEVVLTQVSEGVYDCQRGTDRIRVVVANQLPEVENNAPLHLFAAQSKKAAYGAKHYRPRSEKTSTLILKLFEGYELEGIPMPQTPEQVYREWINDNIDKILSDCTREQIANRFTVEELEQLLNERRTAEAAAKAKKPRRPAKDGPA